MRFSEAHVFMEKMFMKVRRPRIISKQGIIGAISFLSIFFILNFIFSLIAAAICLAINLETLADNISVYAYYSLLIGVTAQLISFIIEERWRPTRADKEG
ncbi:MAG: hypothetical protein QXU09_04470 [Thermoproteota archaeon]|nr:hypothetical protein [Candidatus Bathyarchaeota archaeon]